MGIISQICVFLEVLMLQIETYLKQLCSSCIVCDQYRNSGCVKES